MNYSDHEQRMLDIASGEAVDRQMRLAAERLQKAAERIQVEKLPHGAGLPLPAFMTEGAAGMDLYAACEDEVLLWHSTPTWIPTGIKVEIPKGYEGQVRARSSMAQKGIITHFGTIDCDYRGELKVLLLNVLEARSIKRGERIAQLIISKVERLPVIEVSRLSETTRGEGGFGSTGV
jgi:dUTP pyrophosphatase